MWRWWGRAGDSEKKGIEGDRDSDGWQGGQLRRRCHRTVPRTVNTVLAWWNAVVATEQLSAVLTALAMSEGSQTEGPLGHPPLVQNLTSL